MKKYVINEQEEKRLDNILGGLFLGIFFLELIFFICTFESVFFGWKLVYFISIVTIVLDILIGIYFVFLLPRIKSDNETVVYYKQAWIILFIIVAGVHHNAQGIRYISDMVSGPMIVESSSYYFGGRTFVLYDEEYNDEHEVIYFKSNDWKKWHSMAPGTNIEVSYYPKTRFLKSVRIID